MRAYEGPHKKQQCQSASPRVHEYNLQYLVVVQFEQARDGNVQAAVWIKEDCQYG
jgi:hypothetical protein